MDTLVLTSNLLCIALGTVVGVRMLLLARKTGRRPELTIGLGLVMFAAIAQPATISGPMLGELFGRTVRLGAIFVGAAGHAGLIVALFVFNRMVFRPTSSPALAAVWIAGISTTLASVGLVASIASVPMEAPLGAGARISTVVIVVGATSAFGWAAIEALRYHSMMRRRLRIGLADPVVVNRFFVWGISWAICTVITLGQTVCGATGLSFATHPLPRTLTIAAGLVLSAGWLLTFLAPTRYQDWVRRLSQSKTGVDS